MGDSATIYRRAGHLAARGVLALIPLVERKQNSGSGSGNGAERRFCFDCVGPKNANVAKRQLQ
jgi:hypothetical protein